MLSKRAITLCKIILQLMIITKIMYAIIGGLRSGGLKSDGLMFLLVMQLITNITLGTICNLLFLTATLHVRERVSDTTFLLC